MGMLWVRRASASRSPDKGRPSIHRIGHPNPAASTSAGPPGARLDGELLHLARLPGRPGLAARLLARGPRAARASRLGLPCAARVHQRRRAARLALLPAGASVWAPHCPVSRRRMAWHWVTRSPHPA